jgi:hypothetical protein
MATELKNWHYNFRNKDQLPDLKTLQREFHFSVISMAFACLLFCYYGVGLLHGLGLHFKIKNLEEQAMLKEQQSLQCIQKNSLFKQYQCLVEDLKNIYQPILDPVRSIAFLSKAIPPEFIFQVISFKENQKLSDKGLGRTYELVLDAFMSGNEEKALALIESFKKNLMEIDFFKKSMQDLKVEGLKRDSQYANILNFSIKIQLNPS